MRGGAGHWLNDKNLRSATGDSVTNHVPAGAMHSWLMSTFYPSVIYYRQHPGGCLAIAKWSSNKKYATPLSYNWVFPRR